MAHQESLIWYNLTAGIDRLIRMFEVNQATIGLN